MLLESIITTFCAFLSVLVFEKCNASQLFQEIMNCKQLTFFLFYKIVYFDIIFWYFQSRLSKTLLIVYF